PEPNPRDGVTLGAWRAPAARERLLARAQALDCAAVNALHALHALLVGACALFSACAAANPESIEIGSVARDAEPRILAVIAHPDDATAFAASLYVSSRHLGGRSEVFVITNGEGGFKYSGLAERLYGAPLTIEAVGRARLPDLRRYEMVQSALILGVA